MLSREIRYTKEYYKKIQKKIYFKEVKYGGWWYNEPIIDGTPLAAKREHYRTLNALNSLENTAIHMMHLLSKGKRKARELLKDLKN